MTTAWRICKAKYAATAFDGQGAKATGGRWNPPGTAVVYASAAASQAVLEILAHADSTILSLSYVLIPVQFDDSLVSVIDPATLPSNWFDDQSATRDIGAAWVRSSTSAILRVPSAILSVEHNYLLNPAHADFRQVQIGPPQPLMIDERIRNLFAST